jgi:hypothetical protein
MVIVHYFVHFNGNDCNDGNNMCLPGQDVCWKQPILYNHCITLFVDNSDLVGYMILYTGVIVIIVANRVRTESHTA